MPLPPTAPPLPLNQNHLLKQYILSSPFHRADGVSVPWLSCRSGIGKPACTGWISPNCHPLFSLAHLPLSGGIGFCFALHVRHHWTSLRTAPSSPPDTHTDTCHRRYFLMICPALPLQSETMNGMEKSGLTQVCSACDVFSKKETWMGRVNGYTEKRCQW